jgi:hypothetical protein
MFREIPAPKQGIKTNFEEKNKAMRTTSNISLYVLPLVLTLILSLSARAQGPVYHPGQTIRISVTFEGPDAGRIKQVQMHLVNTKSDPSQPGYSYQINGGSSERKGNTNTFEVSWEIHPNQASGDYSLNQLNVAFDQDNQISISYVSPADFPERIFKIDNHASLVKPTIKDVKQLP